MATVFQCDLCKGVTPHKEAVGKEVRFFETGEAGDFKQVMRLELCTSCYNLIWAVVHNEHKRPTHTHQEREWDENCPACWQGKESDGNVRTRSR